MLSSWLSPELGARFLLVVIRPPLALAGCGVVTTNTAQSAELGSRFGVRLVDGNTRAAQSASEFVMGLPSLLTEEGYTPLTGWRLSEEDVAQILACLDDTPITDAVCTPPVVFDTPCVGAEPKYGTGLPTTHVLMHPSGLHPALDRPNDILGSAGAPGLASPALPRVSPVVLVVDFVMGDTPYTKTGVSMLTRGGLTTQCWEQLTPTSALFPPGSVSTLAYMVHMHMLRGTRAARAAHTQQVHHQNTIG